MPINAAGFEISGGPGITVGNGDGKDSGDITINVADFTTNQLVNIEKNGVRIGSTSEINFKSSKFVKVSVSGNGSKIMVQPNVINVADSIVITAGTDETSESVLKFSAETGDNDLTLTLEANTEDATSGQLMSVDPTGNVKWENTQTGLKSLEIILNEGSSEILDLSVTPNNPIIVGDEATISLNLKAPEPAAQKFVKWNATAGKYVYGDISESNIASLGLTIGAQSAKVLAQTTPTLTASGNFSLGFTGGTPGQVAAFSNTSEEMDWFDTLKSVSVVPAANAQTSVVNYTTNPITTSGTFVLGFPTDGITAGSILQYNQLEDEVLVVPADPTGELTSVGISSSVGAPLTTSGGPVTTSGTLVVGFDTTGADSGDILMNTGGTMGWDSSANGNAALPQVVAAGYDTFSFVLPTPPTGRAGKAFSLNVGTGFELSKFIGVAYPSARGTTQPVFFQNLTVFFGSYSGSTLTGFFVGWNPPDDQGFEGNIGRGFNYVIYYIPS